MNMASPRLTDIIHERIRTEGPLSFRDFSELALYHPTFGYYRRAHARVGRNDDTDFYTAESLGPVFARLVCQAAQNLLNCDDSDRFSFIELGAEPGQSPFAEIAPNYFANYRAIHSREVYQLDGPCIIFANELLDAQPFHRLVFHNGRWHECGVAISPTGLTDCLLHELSPQLRELSPPLPESAPEGYRLDISIDAVHLVQQLTAQAWHGLLILADYGRAWQELITNYPAGTARAYHRHQVSNQLLEHPGQQDLTCHVSWDHISVALQDCSPPLLQRQEAFFVHHAQAVIEQIITADPGKFSSDRQTLSELLHPHHMGSRFQFLSTRKNLR